MAIEGRDERILLALVGARVALLRTGGGNPYHDADGKFASGPGGEGNPARRKRRRARLHKRREALRKAYKRKAKELKSSYKATRRESLKEYRRDVSRIRRESRQEYASTVKQARKDLAAASKPSERNEIREQARHDISRIREEKAIALKGAREDRASQHATDKAYHREELDSLKDDLRSDAAELRDEFGIRPRRRSIEDGVSRAMNWGRHHKAGSAESILASCLKARGWTREYRLGELSGAEHLELSHDVRRYGRSWLRHEAEQFVRAYLSDVGGVRSIGEDEAFPETIARALASGLASHFNRFFRRAKHFVRELIIGSTMALVGPAPLTGEELEGLDREATKQDQFFDQFFNEIEFWGKPSPRETKLPVEPGIPVPTVQPTMTPAQFVARVERYADSSHRAAQRANREAAIRNPAFAVEMLVLGDPKTEHCSECPVDAAKGWVPIGSMRPIGDRICKQLCLCHFQYSDRPGGKAYVQGKRGPLPAPAIATVQPEPEGNAGEVEIVAEPPGQMIDVPIAGPAKR